MDGFLNIFLNSTISLLLVVTIGYAVVLNRKLRHLQSRQSDLVAILGRLDGALATACVTVSAFRESADAEQADLPVEEPPPPPRAVRRAEPVAQRIPEAPRPAPIRAPTPPVEVTAKSVARKPKAVLRADTLADRLETARLRPADGQPLVVKASAPRPVQGPVSHRAASDELMSVMRSLRKG
jgi:hypothetical protein